MRPAALRAPYLKAAALFVVVLVLYGGFRFATWETERRREMAMGHEAPGFFCKFTFPPQTPHRPGDRSPQLLFTFDCIPDCSTRPAPPDKSAFVGWITAAQTTPAIWHKACDGKAP